MPNLLTHPEHRSTVMRLIRSSGTRPEQIVCRAMRERGVYFQPNYGKAPGRPDLARPRDRLAVFVDGDFWHGRALPRIESSHGIDGQWAIKLRRNVDRDRRRDYELAELGWSVLHVWESDIVAKTRTSAVLDEIERFLRSRNAGHSSKL